MDKEYLKRVNELPISEIYAMSSIGFEFVVEAGKITEVVANG